MEQINIKPLSVNEAWQGKRYKTDKYKYYEKELLLLLKPMKIPEGNLQVFYEFGFSSKLSDWDNPIKCLQDILQKKFNFNDSRIFKATVTKKIVPRGKEYLKFKIKSL